MNMEEITPRLRHASHPDAAFLTSYSRILQGYDHRLFVCAKGSMTVTVEQTLYPMEQGSALFVPAASPYQYQNMSKDLSIFSFNFDLKGDPAAPSAPIPPAVLGTFRREEMTEKNLILPNELSHPLLANDANFPDTAAIIEREYRHMSPYAAQREGLLLADLLICMVRHRFHRQPTKNAALAARVAKYLRSHYAEPCDNAALGAIFSYHPNYLGRLMLEYTGMSLHKYLNRCRINAAIDLLEGTDFTVSEIAVRVGFHDLPHFSKTFRAFTGRSPIQYRLK